jgi:c-di-GMP-binding flagellar brake protein YcgR
VTKFWSELPELGTALLMPTTATAAITSDHLLRSRIEIQRVLDALITRRQVVTAEIPGNTDPFTAQIVGADARWGFITVTAAADESANKALLARASVTFVSTPDDWHIEFVATGPGKVMHEGIPAIRLRYPEILAIQQRRQHDRHEVTSTVLLRCVADAGGIMPFEAKIRNISLGGISALFYAGDITLEPGTVLVGSRIEVPGLDPVNVDLEVRYSEVVTLPDGSRGHTSGFRFINPPDGLNELIDAVSIH